MQSPPRTVVVFSSDAFDEEPGVGWAMDPPEKAKIETPGRDLALLLCERLAGLGHVADVPYWDELWWLDLRVDGQAHVLWIVFEPAFDWPADEPSRPNPFRPGELLERPAEALCHLPATWRCELRRRAGVFGWLRSKERRAVTRAAAETVHEALAAMPEVRDVRWHEGIDHTSSSGHARP